MESIARPAQTKLADSNSEPTLRKKQEYTLSHKSQFQWAAE